MLYNRHPLLLCEITQYNIDCMDKMETFQNLLHESYDREEGRDKTEGYEGVRRTGYLVMGGG